ncbi:uncharacterized protein TrAFT101_009641 [Trichoderma asperellum]|uniref:Zn(2)-C6 fungal-type domain-containing protein n=1 Tax=Trichoderma asperellum (strain ATCC 204424 / CBS 433.97 / NBRC 101777) TaxID=1042311 RepID=A0A2T3ZAB7_TRIA4|nr:hypothetical protein M441DRAFT_68762 [Trichoderma asperellum CBS 433.97]PTB41745.1 hypothetical protein M441DRAFT_68762 [Trichoderma asperellum CBS 433.97]UKZ94786.1 hypothetical protein TrAFT101_009641 [Trichoderma asperellum]
MTISSKGPQCWECLRRNSPCDGKTPICGNCSSAGMVCPGFTNNRPLTWLRTGMVSRIQKGKPAARPNATAAARDSRRRSSLSTSSTSSAIIPSPKSITSTPPRSRVRRKAARSDRGSDAGTPSGASSSGCSSGDSPPDSSSNSTAVASKAISSRDGDEDEDGGSLQSIADPRHQLVACRNRSGNSPADGAMQIHVTAIPPDLRPQDWDYIDAIKMYNNQLLPRLRSRQIIQNPAWVVELNGDALQSLSVANRHCFLAIAVGYHIMYVTLKNNLSLEPATTGPAAHLWWKFYLHINTSISALNDDIQQSFPNILSLFSSMAHLMSADILLFNSNSWRVHADAYLLLIKLCGGLKKLMNSSTTPLLMQSFVIGVTVFNTTSPSNEQMVDACNFDVDDVMTIYELGSSPLFYCPAPLFKEMFLINRLRLEAAVSGGDSKPSLCGVLERIDAYPIQVLTDCMDRKKAKDLHLVSLLFKSAVAVFGSMTLPCTSECSSRTPCAELQKTHREHLLHLLDASSEFMPLLDHILWPVIVAGAAAATESVESQMLVEMYLLNSVRDPYTGGCTRVALATMRNFWASGKTKWDECFDKPHAWMI